jgi:hypothetical protein
MNNKLKLGSIVRYKNDFWLALSFDGQLVKIIAPHKGQRKLNVSKRKLEVLPLTAGIVNYKDKRHLVTHNGTIVSLLSNRVLKSTTYDGRNILAIAGGFV